MKKLFSILVAFVFMLSLGMVAFAAETNSITPPDPDPDPVIAKIPKKLSLEHTGKLNPAETFVFSFTQEDETDDTNLDLVTIPNASVAFTAGESGLKYGDISLSNFGDAPVGRYTYAVAEVLPDPLTAGMTYTTRTGTLVVDKEYDGTVQSYLIIGPMGNPDNKFDYFDNKFSAGDLTITKQVTGNLGDRDKLFEVTVTLTGPVGPPAMVVKDDVIELWMGGVKIEDVEFVDGVAIVTFEVKDGDTFTIKNLPYGVTYVVEEKDPEEGYDVTYTGDTGTINKVLSEAKIVNDKDTDIPTGISLDSLPYILILGLAGSGMGVLFFKRRHAF